MRNKTASLRQCVHDSGRDMSRTISTPTHLRHRPGRLPQGSELGPPLLVDSHVHWHGAFAPTSFFDAAWANITAARGTDAGDAVGCLMLAEPVGDNRFARLRCRQHIGPWSVDLTEEANSLLVRNGNRTLIVLAGRQIESVEGVEVLGLCWDGKPARERPAAELVRQIADDCGLAVLPWGCGKWIGHRGRVVRSILKAQAGKVFLGDNSGRLRVGPRPSHFALAARLQVPIVPGSDPLPLAWQTRRAGGYGFVLHTAVSSTRPGRDLACALRALRSSPEPFGRRSGVLAFVSSQLAMQWVKRRRVGG